MTGRTTRCSTTASLWLRFVTVCALAWGALLLAVPDGAAQSAAPDDGRPSGAAVDSPRVERPRAAPPTDWVDVVLIPVRVAAFPINLVGEGIELAIGPAMRAAGILGELENWGLNVGVGSVGPRSGPGGKLQLTRFAPFHLRSELSFRGSHRHGAWLRLGREAPTATVGGTFRRWAEPLFWGIGADAEPEDVVDYRWDQWDASLESRLVDGESLRLGVGGGWELNRTGAGSDPNTPDITSRYDSEDLVGLAGETQFARAEASVTLDETRRSAFQNRGAELSVAGTIFRGLSGTRADFHRIEVRGGGYLPLNPFQMLALRGRLQLNRADGEPGVPFTHLASLGDEPGSRAYPDGRFRGNDLAAVTLEYRWELWRETWQMARLEAYLFYERGVVAGNVSRIASRDWRPSYGLGVRLLDGGGPLFGGYVAEGDEGVRVQLRATVEP